MQLIKKNRNYSSDAMGIHAFTDEIGSLNFRKVNERMQLIEENKWRMSVYLARRIVRSDGSVIDGVEPENYAQFRVQLSEISSKLNLFIYQIKKNSNITYNDRVGEIYYMENGEDFFVDGRLDKKKLEEEGGLFIDL